MKTDWEQAFKPLLAKYRGQKHPLEYKNLYQLVVMVILSAQDSDRHINQLAPDLFKVYPNMEALAQATEQSLYPLIGKVRNSANKGKWLISLAKTLKTDAGIPLTLDGLTALTGIGRKSANVILREAGAKAEGVIVDLHVVRVAPRLGVASGTDPKKIEKQIMEAVPQKDWGEIGMAISFLGRDTCRPSNPKHHECVMNSHCAYFAELFNKAGKRTVPVSGGLKQAPVKASASKDITKTKKAAPAKTVKKAAPVKKAASAKKKTARQASTKIASKKAVKKVVKKVAAKKK